MPLLTVVMPVRNGALHLRAALDSTLAALPRDAELLVLDDGSSDGTASILDATDDHRLRVLHSATGLGLAPGLNHLIEHSDSAFVARMDADDICLPWRFTRQMRTLERADAAFTAIVFMGPSGRTRRPDLPGAISPAAAPLQLLLASSLCHPTAMLRRQALPAVPYRSVAAEDYDLWLRLSAAGARIVKDAVPALRYRVHPEQTSSQPHWLARRARDSADGSTWASYLAAAEAVGLGGAVSPAGFEFAQSLQLPPDADADTVRTVLAGFAAIEARAAGLGRRDRYSLALRLHSLRRTVARRADHLH